MRFSSLSDWLQWQEHLHFTEIDPGLDRLGAVWQKMDRPAALPFKLLTIAGTNGKGSSVAISSTILRSAGYKVATYTSPHLLRYNERICINGEPCSDEQICQAFQRIDDARGDISLTYFEFATLAAMDIFIREQVNVAVLEVGMGGRLDAVNLFDADIALITPVGLDHIQWLGDTREKIGREKAGIIRSEHPVVLSESSPPESIKKHAEAIQAPIFIAGRDYHYEDHGNAWSWVGQDQAFKQLPYPALVGKYQLQNSAAVIQVCQLFEQQGLTIPEKAIRAGLENVVLAGRFQVILGEVTTILDVTHNQQGAQNLKELLHERCGQGKTYAVLAMLRDKDASAVVSLVDSEIEAWFIAGLEGSRGMSAEKLVEIMRQTVAQQKLNCLEDVDTAYQAALAKAKPGDSVLVFGSFHTVEAVMRFLKS